MENTIRTYAVELNLGLKTSDKFGNNRPDYIAPSFALNKIHDVSRALGFEIIVLKCREFISSTERTLAIKLKVETFGPYTIQNLVEVVAWNCWQEAIATLHCDPVEHAARHNAQGELDGALYGPFAASWGAFNPVEFERFAIPQTKANQGHLANNGGVQSWSADPDFARFGLVLVAHDNGRGRRIWQGIARGRPIFNHPTHAGCIFGCRALLTGA